MLRELLIDREGYVAAGARWNVVEDDRLIGRVCDRREVLDESLRSRLVVVGRDEQKRVGADLTGVPRESDRVIGVVRARARDDRDASGDPLDTVADALAVLLVGERRRLAGRSADDDGVGRIRDLALDHLAELLIVYLVVREGGDDGDRRSGENCGLC